jgi:L-asparaginase II
LLAARTRSGLVETTHEGAVAVVSADGELVAWSGDIDRPYFLRSAAKPFQAAVAQEHGALLRPVELALAAASHDGQPVHVAVVAAMLEAMGLDEEQLQCPPTWPLDLTAMRRLAAAGHGAPRRIWNNCSGKHAAWLRACQSGGWPTHDYLSPTHPLQQQIVELISELGGLDATPVGVDGCGAPVPRTTTRAMALLYARLANLPALRPVFVSMHRYPSLVSGSANGDARIAVATNSAAKRGAEGVLGVAVEKRLGLAVKSWDGLQAVADLAMAAALDATGVVSGHVATELESVRRPTVHGGGRPVGMIESRLELEWV